MEIIGPLLLLGALFILFGGIEDRDNKSELGKEMIADLNGPEKIAQKSSGGCFVLGGFIIVLIVAIITIMSGETLW